MSLFCSNYCTVLYNRSTGELCHQCNKLLEKQGLKCRGCGNARYCSIECQKEHWKSEHKNQCKLLSGQHRVMLIDSSSKFTCYNCFKASAKPFEQCSGCKTIVYCSAECQRAHWKQEHKKQCKVLQKQNTKS